MKKFEYILYKDWKYKLIALGAAITLWAIVNFGNRVHVTIERQIRVINAKSNYSYEIRPAKVKIKLTLIERLNRASIFSEIVAFVNVKNMEIGRSNAEVEVYIPLRPFISVKYIEPPRVEVYITPNRKRSYHTHKNQ